MAMCHACRRTLLAGERYRTWRWGRRDRTVCAVCEPAVRDARAERGGGEQRAECERPGAERRERGQGEPLRPARPAHRSEVDRQAERDEHDELGEGRETVLERLDLGLERRLDVADEQPADED